MVGSVVDVITISINPDMPDDEGKEVIPVYKVMVYRNIEVPYLEKPVLPTFVDRVGPLQVAPEITDSSTVKEYMFN